MKPLHLKHIPPLASALIVTCFMTWVFVDGFMFGKQPGQEIVNAMLILAPLYLVVSYLSSWLTFKRWGFIIPLAWGFIGAVARAIQSASWSFISWDFYWGGIMYAFIYGTVKGLICAAILLPLHYYIKRNLEKPAQRTTSTDKRIPL